MPYGTVRWYNKKTGAGFIRTDDGKDVIFLNGDILDTDPNTLYKGARVCLDILMCEYGKLAAINVKATEI